MRKKQQIHYLSKTIDKALCGVYASQYLWAVERCPACSSHGSHGLPQRVLVLSREELCSACALLHLGDATLSGCRGCWMGAPTKPHTTMSLVSEVLLVGLVVTAVYVYETYQKAKALWGS
jgi:hypothetical protein